MIHYVKGNLLDSDCDYICHQVNCQGVMNSGVARQIRERWPEVYEGYKRFCDRATDNADPLLGRVFIARPVDGKRVVNMFSQYDYGYDGGRYTSYNAFANCLSVIKEHISIDKTIGFPKNIGCGLGGGDWNIISSLIEEVLGEEYEVYIYVYSEN